jgi:hypothetical protein
MDESRDELLSPERLADMLLFALRHIADLRIEIEALRETMYRKGLVTPEEVAQIQAQLAVSPASQTCHKQVREIRVRLGLPER